MICILAIHFLLKKRLSAFFTLPRLKYKKKALFFLFDKKVFYVSIMYINEVISKVIQNKDKE